MASKGNPVLVSVKGGAVLMTVEDIKRRRGDSGYEQVLGDLDEVTSALFHRPVDPEGWLPVGALVRLMEANARRFDGGDESAVLRGSEKVMERQLKSAFSGLFIKHGSPETVIRKLALIHMSFFNGVGLECKVQGPGQAIIRYTGFQKEHRLIELSIMAFFRKALELAGAKDVQVAFATSIAEGGPYADLNVTWR